MDLEKFWESIQSALDALGLDISNEQLIVSAGIGIAAGWLASQLVGGKSGLIRYLVAGIIGSFLGPIIVSYSGITLPVLGLAVVNEIMVATVGAVVVVLVARIVG